MGHRLRVACGPCWASTVHDVAVPFFVAPQKVKHYRKGHDKRTADAHPACKLPAGCIFVDKAVIEILYK